MNEKNEKGQTVIAVVVLLILAMSIGVTVAESFYKRLHMFSNVDSMGKAQAAAEASIERILTKDDDTLEGYINNNNCGADCYYEITGFDGIKATSTITLSFLGNSYDPYKLTLTGGQTSELTMDGFGSSNISLCWNYSGPGSLAPAVYASFIHGQPGNYDDDVYAYNSVNSTNTDNNFDTADTNAHSGYNNCFKVIGKVYPRVLRVKSFYSDVIVYAIAEGIHVVPKQGIVIVANGVSGEANKQVTVTKTDVDLPTQFDYVLFQKSLTDPLSN